MMKYTSLLLLGLVFLFSCEKEIELDFEEHTPQYIVEGYIEKNFPPLILLSKSDSYYNTISPESLLNGIVTGAEMQISDGINTYDLIEIKTTDILEVIQNLQDSLNLDIEVDLSLLDELLGVPTGTLSSLTGGTGNIDLASQLLPDISIYTSIELIGVENRTYSLRVTTPENTILTANTYLPFPSPLDSLWYVPHPTNDTLVTLTVRYTDDALRANYLRYFTQRNSEAFSPPPFTSVLDDRSIFNLAGESFNFPLERGQNRNNPNFKFSTYSYFSINDTVQLRWASMGEAHFNFWKTLEFDRSQAGNPFGRPTKISSNINGGLGIWGAYNSSFYNLPPYSQTNP